MTLSKSLSRVLSALVLGAALFIASAELAPGHAEAQCSTTSGATCSQVRPDGKAMIGLGLMGAELGLFLPAVFGARDWWPYLIFPVVGAAGGAIGGYFLEQGTQSEPEIAVTLLVIGAALAIPAIVGTLALTAYSPPSNSEDTEADDDTFAPTPQGDSVEAVQDPGPTSAPAADSAPQARMMRAYHTLFAGGPGLLRFDGPRILVALPIVSARPTYTAEETERLRLAPSSDIHVPLVSATF